MNKNLNKIVAMALSLGVVSAVAPATNINLLTTKAYATDTNDTDTLSSLKLETPSGSNIKLYSDNDYDSDNKVDEDDVEEGDTYYAKTSSSTISIDTDGPDDDYIKVFKGTSDSTKGKDVGKSIYLSEGTTIITVKIYNEEPDDDVRYDNEDEDADVIGEYTIKVKYTGSDSTSDSEEDSDSYDYIYLEKLTVEGEKISLSNSKVTYSYNVASDVDEVTIKAVPEEDYYTVTIDGNEVNEDDDNYKDDVSINKGENEIKVKIENEDDDEERIYTLKITRGSSSSTSTNNTASTTPDTAATIVTTAIKTNQWVQTNGIWQYNDSTGTPVKNIWVQNYYLQADGNMATGWVNYGGNRYLCRNRWS